MFDHYGGYMAGMHALGWIFWVALVALIFFLGRGRCGPDARTPRDTPHDILKRRLAAGELSPEDYEQRKALLDRDK